MSSYRFALRPRWLLSHLLIVVLVVVMISLGFWQLRRLDERKTYNDAVPRERIVAGRADRLAAATERPNEPR